jgi:hypothetical protein
MVSEDSTFQKMDVTPAWALLRRIDYDKLSKDMISKIAHGITSNVCRPSHDIIEYNASHAIKLNHKNHNL